MTVWPDQSAVDRALQVAMSSPCRSKRGVVIYDAMSGALLGEGSNGPPLDLGCPGRERCAGNCGVRSMHAEARALRDMALRLATLGIKRRRWPHELYELNVVHVELGRSGGVVACDGPSCPTCAREILDVGLIAAVWLYESRPPRGVRDLDWCTQDDRPCALCLYCQNEACRTCGSSRSGRCLHDVLDRHAGMTGINARWIRYTASDFYRITLENCGVTP